MKILCVDDDPAALLIISSMIEHLGYEPLEASTAEQALEHLLDPEVSLVLCDWEMPGMNGPDLCRYIRASDFGSYVYFILITGRTEKESLIEGLNAGADDFVNKPVNQEEMRVRLRGAERVLRLEQTLDARNAKLEAANSRIELAFANVTADLKLAAEMQFGLLPKQQQIYNLSANWMFKPASFIAGDIFDYFSVDENHIVFYIVDVEGHGIPSALTSFAVNNLLNPTSHGMCKRHLHSAGSVDTAVIRTVEELNLHFSKSDSSNRYFTMIYGVLDLRSGHVTMTQAGHPPALHYSARDNVVREIGEGGMPLGMFKEAQYTTVSCDLEPGDRLFIYSDGTIECPRKNGDLYGPDQLGTKVLEWAATPIEKVNSVLDKEFVDWNGSNQFEDDVSMVCFEFHSPYEIRKYA